MPTIDGFINRNDKIRSQNRISEWGKRKRISKILIRVPRQTQPTDRGTAIVQKLPLIGCTVEECS